MSFVTPTVFGLRLPDCVCIGCWTWFGLLGVVWSLLASGRFVLVGFGCLALRVGVVMFDLLFSLGCFEFWVRVCWMHLLRVCLLCTSVF